MLVIGTYLTTLQGYIILRISDIVTLAPSYLGAFKLTNSALGYILKTNNP